MKKFISLFVAIIFTAAIFCVKTANVEAATINSDFVRNQQDYINKELSGGINLVQQRIESLIYGDEVKNLWGKNTIQYLEFPAKATASDVQLVVWSKGTSNSYQGNKTTVMAKDYEALHPGYIVIAAINGDFFYIQDDCAPLYTHVQEGNVYRTAQGAIAVGFDGTSGAKIGAPSFTATHNLHLLNKDEIVATNGMDINLGATGVTLYSPASKNVIDAEGYTIYRCTYTTYRTKLGDIYLKGNVTEVIEGTNGFNTASTSFYIVSKDQLDLAVGDEVKAQRDVTGEFAAYKNIIGAPHRTLINGEIQYRYASSSTDNKNPRTCIGIRPDGTMVFLVANGRQAAEWSDGITLFEEGAILKGLGCNEGINLDGGGSSTLAVRNETGNFDIINAPSDGNEREDGNSILVVIRDPKITVEEVSDRSVKVKQNGAVADGEIQNINVKIGTKSGNLAANGEAVIEGLVKNSEYVVKYTYEIKNEDGSISTCSGSKAIKTAAFALPVVEKFEFYKQTADTVTFKYEYVDRDAVITSAYIQYGTETFDLTSKSGRAEITGLDRSKAEDFKLILNYENGSVQSETVNVEAFTSSGGGSTGGCNFGVYYVLTMIACLGAAFLMKKRS